ncbi:MAG: hypothetical protein QXS37_04515 [Candidatus Aenigmatarchaeota archaeon]
MKGQISIELIIILAILLALVLIVASKLQETAKKTTEEIGSTQQQIFEKINESKEVGRKKAGEICTYSWECESGSCVGGICS